MSATENTNSPQGLTERTSHLAAERAHEQGWGLNEDERRAPSPGQQNTAGGTNYNYGAQDFGDEPTNMGPEPSEQQLAQAKEFLTKK